MATEKTTEPVQKQDAEKSTETKETKETGKVKQVWNGSEWVARAVKVLLVVLAFGAVNAHALPPNTYNIYTATTQTVASGTGSLFGIAIASGAAGDYAVCYDTATANVNWATATGTSTFPELMRVFVSSASAAGSGPIINGYLPSSVPLLYFTHGLTCATSAAQRTFIWYRQPN